MTASQQSKKNSKLFEDCRFLCYLLIQNYRYFHVLFTLFFTIAEAKCSVRPHKRTLFEDSNSYSENEEVVETLPKPSVEIQGCSHPSFLFPESVLEPPKSLLVLGLTKVRPFVLH